MTATDQHASWLPHDIKYNPIYEDALTSLLLSPPSSPAPGLRVLAPDSAEDPVPNESISLTSIELSTLPLIDLSALPIPLTDPRRVYASPIPGLLLTHPNGYLEGGPGLSPEEDEYPRHFVAEHRVRSLADLEGVKAREIERFVDMARERARKRREGHEKNARIDAEIRTLQEQMDMERKVLGKVRERARERRERKERGRKG